jgi:hypothetical protein
MRSALRIWAKLYRTGAFDAKGPAVTISPYWRTQEAERDSVLCSYSIPIASF